MTHRAAARLRAPSISVQMLALLLGALVAAQAATFVMSTMFPGPPALEYRLHDIAEALRGGPLRLDGLPPLERAVQARAPDPRSPGWQVSEGSRRELAGELGVAPQDVELLFYSPPPFAGANGARAAARASGGAGLFAELLGPPAWAAPPGGGFPGGGYPRDGGGQGPQGSGRGPGGRGGGRGAGADRGASHGGEGPGAPGGQVFEPPVAPLPQGAPDAASPIPTARPAGGRLGDVFGGAPGVAAPLGASGPPLDLPDGGAPWSEAEPPVLESPPVEPSARPARVTPSFVATPAPRASLPAATPGSAARPLEGPTGTVVRGAAEPEATVAQVVPAPVTHGLFGTAEPAMVDGEFLAALRTAPGRWITVRPLQDPILSRWQRRLGLWFLAAFAVTAPLGWWMSRRLARPLAALADTADQLGRDASTLVPVGGGAPEIRRLAAALAGMQTRLQRHVEDRTAMVGAISHDLRTPLARMRFKLERAPPALQASLLRDMDHMQEMLDAVLLFIRDASGPSPRETVDLRSIVECVVDDAALVGGDAALEPGGPAAVHVDIVAVQRVVTNLVENALKYGRQARVRLRSDGPEAIVDVQDAGPGLPPEEIEQVFQPFYRSEAGRRANAKGIGLGLPVSRSIARAHGGEVALRNGEAGLLAELRLPLALSPSVPADRDYASAA